MPKYSVADLISASLEDKPLDVNQFFFDLMKGKAEEYVDNKVEDISNKIFNSSDEDDLEIDVDEVEDGEQLELDIDQDEDEEDTSDEDLDDEDYEETEEDGEDA